MPIANPPLITIGITAFNAADTLARAIDCALAQNWPKKEILIVDDCSTDNTGAIIEEYKSRHSGITSFTQTANQGVAAARNVLLRNAKGDFIAFFDDDDISAADRIEKQYSRIQKYKKSDLVLCHTARRQIYPDGVERIETTPGCDEAHATPQGRAMFERILTGKPVAHGFGSLATCSLMMPRSTFEKVGLYDEDFRRSEDSDFTLRFALLGGHFIGIAEPLVTQKMTRSSEKTLSDEKFYHEKLYLKHKDALGLNKAMFGLDWLNLKYAFLRGRHLSFIIGLVKLGIRHPLLTLQRLSWALPNISFNLSARNFHRDAA